MQINWEAITAITGIIVVVGGVVHFVVKGALAQFKEDLRTTFVTHEWAESIERRLAILENDGR